MLFCCFVGEGIAEKRSRQIDPNDADTAKQLRAALAAGKIFYQVLTGVLINPPREKEPPQSPKRKNDSTLKKWAQDTMVQSFLDARVFKDHREYLCSKSRTGGLMDFAFREACEQRRKQGLPVPRMAGYGIFYATPCFDDLRKMLAIFIEGIENCQDTRDLMREGRGRKAGSANMPVVTMVERLGHALSTALERAPTTSEMEGLLADIGLPRYTTNIKAWLRDQEKRVTY